ncbi:helix-turn-helix domain-containing protein [Lacticaseibacillus yichunensis]|uniref:Helix-turn-helix domain-containing protein n=1 Tax=Lacticaseibacillus yichunensis TaxID=2486015 RepID=A0ABW4CJU9_9LACO|nr:helix-turn-helix transcriptional regulator [Lacticaseibacillus yichunensis]
MLDFLPKRLIDLREERQLSQSEVARRVGMDNSSLSRIESGSRKVSAEELGKFAALYGVTTDYLLGVNNTPEWATEQDTIDLKKVLSGQGGPTFNFGGDKLTEDQNAKLNLALTQIFWEEIQHDRKRGGSDGQ